MRTFDAGKLTAYKEVNDGENRLPSYATSVLKLCVNDEIYFWVNT